VNDTLKRADEPTTSSSDFVRDLLGTGVARTPWEQQGDGHPEKTHTGKGDEDRAGSPCRPLPRGMWANSQEPINGAVMAPRRPTPRVRPRLAARLCAGTISATRALTRFCVVGATMPSTVTSTISPAPETNPLGMRISIAAQMSPAQPKVLRDPSRVATNPVDREPMTPPAFSTSANCRAPSRGTRSSVIS